MGDETDGPTHVEPTYVDVVVVLPSDADAPRIARQFVSEHATVLSPELIDDALMLVSEVVSNAVQHGRPGIVLRLRERPPGIGVSVQDTGGGEPELPLSDPDPSAVCGRGLRIVDAVASSWGVERNDPPPGKVVWFELHATHA